MEWRGSAPTPAIRASGVGRSTPRAVGPSATDRPDRRRRARHYYAPVPESSDSQRMREMHPRSAGVQHVESPVPAVGCFQHHLGVGASLLELQFHRDRIVDDPTAESCSPDSDWPTITDRCRCRSIPTNCLPSYSSIGASRDSWKCTITGRAAASSILASMSSSRARRRHPQRGRPARPHRLRHQHPG
jgi:hypothetical protein